MRFAGRMDPGSGAGALGFGHTGSCADRFAVRFAVESRRATCVVSPCVRCARLRAVSGHHAVLVGSPLAESCRAVSAAATDAFATDAFAGASRGFVSQASATAPTSSESERERRGIDELDTFVKGVFATEG